MSICFIMNRLCLKKITMNQIPPIHLSYSLVFFPLGVPLITCLCLATTTNLACRSSSFFSSAIGSWASLILLHTKRIQDKVLKFFVAELMFPVLHLHCQPYNWFYMWNIQLKKDNFATSDLQLKSSLFKGKKMA